MPWPDEAEFIDFLIGSGLRASTPTALDSLLDTEGVLEAAIEEWDDRTHYWPFLSTGVSEIRTFDYPNAKILDLDGGLLQLLWLRTQVSASNSDGVAWDVNQWFRLEPRNASQKKKPYTYIEFNSWQGGWEYTWIDIHGYWGYCTEENLPKRARRGVMTLAAMRLLPQIQTQISRGGLIRLQQGDSTKEWGFRELKEFWDDALKQSLSGFVRDQIGAGARR